ncbi:MAG: hypothetical protein PHN69_02790 [Candidatus Pacebacteria bacterium]|nr:hypothetical protein [Candidatus Paceibacterota bacterium]
MILVEIRGLPKNCSKSDLLARLCLKIKDRKVRDPEDIKFAFTTNEVFDGLGKKTSFCIVYVSGLCCQEDFALLVNILREEYFSREKISVINFDSLPLHVTRRIS